MYFYQNKHGRLEALLVLLLTQVHIGFQKNQLFEVISPPPPHVLGQSWRYMYSGSGNTGGGGGS
jgi:hypothetical protein